jgi:hypothetical protein
MWPVSNRTSWTPGNSLGGAVVVAIQHDLTAADDAFRRQCVHLRRTASMSVTRSRALLSIGTSAGDAATNL